MIFLNMLVKNFSVYNEAFGPVKEPTWTTPNKIILSNERIYLRDFSVGHDECATIIISPQAGHHSNIADYGQGNSLVEAVLNSGKKSVFVPEWRSATLSRKNDTIDDFILEMDKVIKFTECQKVNLIGLCQGGWQSAIYASLFPEKINSLILAAAPIDFKAGNGMIQTCAGFYSMMFYQDLVAMGRGNMKGSFMVIAFKMLNPMERFFGDYVDLYNNIEDEKFMDRYRKFRNWYEWTQDLPGEFYLRVVKELFKENKLIKGEMNVLDKKVDLKNIDCPLYLIAGEKDEITLKDQLFNIEDYVSSKVVEKMVVPAGHIGVFMGGEVLREYWPKILSKI